MKKLTALPFHSLYEVNENMYENVIIVAQRSRQIISENSLDLKQIEEGFESTEEMAVALRRSAYSTNIKTRCDFSCCFFDKNLRSIAQSFSQPNHLGSLGGTVKQAVQEYGSENLFPGDQIVTNYPYPGGAHLNDIVVIAPFYYQNEIFGYIANTAHHVDVGGGAPASIGAFSGLIQWTIIIFMFLAATNFSLHYYFIAKRKFEYYKDREFRVYLGLCVIISILFLINISSTQIYQNNLSTIRHSIFTAVSIITTTGFSTENFNDWPEMSKTLLFFLFFIGGSAGSTTGGMKIIRSILITKYLIFEVRKLLHPKGVFPIKIGEKVIPDEVVKNTLGFYLFYIFIFVITSVVYSITGLDLETSLTAAASAIGNIGPGLGSIGPSNNWAHLTDLAKWVTSFTMLMGRLEIFTVVVLFSRSFWRK